MANVTNRGRFLPRFPAAVTPSGPITSTQAGLTLALGADFRPLAAESEDINPQALTVVQNADTGAFFKIAIEDVVAAGNPVPSQEEAEAGVDNEKRMTSLRTKQQIDARLASRASAEAGTATTGLMNELRTKQQIDARVANDATARAQSDDEDLMTSLKVYASVKQLVEHIDIRETRFAGGAPLNGVDDDAPALRAALTYGKTLGGLYTGGSVKIKAPRGIIRLDSADVVQTNCSINLTGCHNITISGEGDGATTFKNSGDRAAFRSYDLTSNPLFRFGMQDFTIEGPGYTNTSAHGIVLGPNNNCLFRDLRVWASRFAMSWITAFHTEIYNFRANGLGGLANYIGMYARDGDLSIAENAVGIFGGRIYGCKLYGFRGECVTGSFISGLEVLGCDSIGVYLGDSPGAKELKWFSWVGGLIDTCPDLLVVKKGSSTVAELLHFSGMWMGYALDANPGAGVGVEFNGIKNSVFAADIIVNTTHAASIQNCDKIYFGARSISQYDRQSVGAQAIICNNTTRSRFDVGTTEKASGSISTVAFIEQGTSNRNLITGIYDGSITTVGANTNATLVVT